MGKSNQVQAVIFGHKQRILPAQDTKYTENSTTQFFEKAPIQIAPDQLHVSPINIFCIIQLTPPTGNFWGKIWF